DRPRVDEHRLDVEDDEENRGEIELHRQLHVPAAGRFAAALVRRHLLGVRVLLAAERGGDEEAEREERSGGEEQEEGQVGRDHADLGGGATRTLGLVQLPEMTSAFM